ncbi:Linearmycin resistance ATP-binding protein LnrL [subsurface metagenome]
MVGLNGKEARAQAMTHLELMGLVERAKGKVDKFSGGMKRRVNLAIALMGHPELLFLSGGLIKKEKFGMPHKGDSQVNPPFHTSGELINFSLGSLHHYMQEADRLCDRVAIMDGGQIIAMDTPYQLRSQIGPPEQVTLEDVFLKLTGRSLRD